MFLAVIYLSTRRHWSRRHLRDCSRLLTSASNRLYRPIRRLLQGGLPFSHPFAYARVLSLLLYLPLLFLQAGSSTTDPIWTVNASYETLLTLKLTSPCDTLLYVARTFLWPKPATALLSTLFVKGFKFGLIKGPLLKKRNQAIWLGCRDSNPNRQIQSLLSYH